MPQENPEVGTVWQYKQNYTEAFVRRDGQKGTIVKLRQNSRTGENLFVFRFDDGTEYLLSRKQLRRCS